jgi:hypothetical protein
MHQPLLIFSSLRIMHFRNQHKTHLLKQPSFKLQLLPLTRSLFLPKYQFLVSSSNHSLLNLGLLLLQLLGSNQLQLSQAFRQTNKLSNQVFQTFLASSPARVKQVTTLYLSLTNSNNPEHWTPTVSGWTSNLVFLSKLKTRQQTINFANWKSTKDHGSSKFL